MTMTLSGSGTIAGLTAGGLPDATIVQTDLAAGVTGTGPAFSAYMTNGSANQSVTPSTWTKAKLDTKEFDTNSNFDSTTNYRFIPSVAGYYQISGSIDISATTTNPSSVIVGIYKNGSLYKQGRMYGSNSTFGSITVTATVYMNGSTDYVELYGNANSGSGTFFTFGSATTYFSGCLVRAA